MASKRSDRVDRRRRCDRARRAPVSDQRRPRQPSMLRYQAPDTETRCARPRHRSFAFMAMTRQPVAKRTGTGTVVRVGVVALASSDVLPGRTTQKSSISLYHHCGNKHQCNAHQSEKNRMRKEENEDCETSDETSDAPANASTTVGVNIRLANVLRETGSCFDRDSSSSARIRCSCSDRGIATPSVTPNPYFIFLRVIFARRDRPIPARAQITS